MALNGIAPLLVIQLKNSASMNVVKKIPVAGDFLSKNVGVPIPIYLDENLTGIFVQGESKAIDIETRLDSIDGKNAPIVSQKALSSVTSVEMVASRTGVLLMTLIAFADLILTRVVAKQYSVSYFNGPTIIVNGVLHGFTTQLGENNDLVHIKMDIATAPQPPSDITPPVEKAIGAPIP
jgi:hypothetical protein